MFLDCKVDIISLFFHHFLFHIFGYFGTLLFKKNFLVKYFLEKKNKIQINLKNSMLILLKNIF